MKRARVLVACEFSGVVRDAFIARGHDAVSCDLLPSDRPGPHIQADVSSVLRVPWDMVIAHPPCTRLALSGVRWLRERDLWSDLDQAAAFFRLCLSANAPRVCVENPIPHRYAVSRIGAQYDQIIQPWMFGHGEQKSTCLWLKGLPLLKPSDVVPGRSQRLHRLPPGPDRWRLRSTTYQGIADAMAAQWGDLL